MAWHHIRLRIAPGLTLGLLGLLAACGGGSGGGGKSSAGGGEELPQYSVTLVITGSGAVDPGGPVQVTQGDTAAFVLTPDEGHGLASVSGCGGTLVGDTYTTAAVAADCEIQVVFETLPPASAPGNLQALAGSGQVRLSWDAVSGATGYNLYHATEAGIDVDNYAASAGGTLVADVSSPYIVTGLVDGTSYYFVVTAVSSAGEGPASAEISATPLSNPLNDTGITACGDYAYGGSLIHQSDLDCAAVGATATVAGSDANGDPVPAGQDAHFGRDVAHNDAGDGHAGFSFTKLDGSGEALAATALNWSCVQDNVTGLVWEVKTDDDGLHDKDYTYTWYNPDANGNGGSAGTENGGTCSAGSGCDTGKYVADVNAAGLCGYNDWRLPGRSELKGMAHYDRSGPALDAAYFPGMTGMYWSSSPYASGSVYAWGLAVYYGAFEYKSKSAAYPVWLVRGGQ